MAYQDNYNGSKDVVAVPAQAVAGDGDIVGEIVDVLGFEAYRAVLATGAVTTGDIVIKDIYESNDSGMVGATIIPAERLFNVPTVITAANTSDALGFLAVKRYVRATVTGANTAALLAAATIVLTEPQSASTRG